MDDWPWKWGGCDRGDQKMGGVHMCGRRPRRSGYPPPKGDFGTFPYDEFSPIFGGISPFLTDFAQFMNNFVEF